GITRGFDTTRGFGPGGSPRRPRIPRGSMDALPAEASCPICLEFFRDPVSIHCGHHFCRACIERCWEWPTDRFACPRCRDTAPQRSLRPSPELARVLEIRPSVRAPPGPLARARRPDSGADLCVLGAPGFASGRHYWEVEVTPRPARHKGGAPGARSGPWAPRARSTSAVGSEQTALAPGEQPRRFGVYLDHERGQLCFYNAESMSHIHTFHICCRERVFPSSACWPRAPASRSAPDGDWGGMGGRDGGWRRWKSCPGLPPPPPPPHHAALGLGEMEELPWGLGSCPGVWRCWPRAPASRSAPDGARGVKWGLGC
uniref:RING-type domain-containing protein n=1 Tax=Catharus ustulatus TaxID=91951 RepID=A0A8C3Y412_CATUS